MKLKKIISLALASALLCGAMAMVSCTSDGDGNTSSAPADESSQAIQNVDYKINVKDALGNGYASDVVVKILKNGEQVAMQPCGENGSVVKNLPAGDYTVELGFTGSESDYYYDKAALVLSADKAEIDIIVSKRITTEPETIVAQSNEYDAYRVDTGCTYVELKAGQRNYFLFVPTKSGNYEFALTQTEGVVFGYYGAPHYIQENSLAEVTDGKFTISVSDGNIGTEGGGTGVYVLGIDVTDDTVKGAVMTINRIGDPIKGIEDYPWTIYEKTVELKEYDLPEGYELKEFDLTASTDTYNLVFNEADGFYHLNSADGPLVLVRLDEDCDYIDCYGTILEYTGVVKYFFDDKGEFVKKENYTNCLMEYLECVDLNEGVYPLTEDLKYIIQQNGDHLGWWKPDHSGFLFEDENGYAIPEINLELGWLLMCCYIE